ncbi:type I phosphomannose isomerase catalytic subunit [Paenibacillus ferrarius]|uniref:type I phosphomannose isomerase catalytic subunit n=1 Tax=Paenibacillus ferrarius TaxID=1469647 RepID=UPI003D28CFA0
MTQQPNRPWKLVSNRVWRTYTGGAVLNQWKHGGIPEDSHFPEEWIASVVKARNPGREHLTNEGLSQVMTEGGPRLLTDLIQADPEGMLGEEHVRKFGNHTGVLVKLLDSAERLTIQVHPDRSAAERLFGSAFGKTEAWYVLGTRRINGTNPYVLLGFKPGVSRTQWEALFRRQDIEGMMDCLHKIEIQQGQVILVEAGIPHAIGPGCFLVEIQEPTDYTIRVEQTTPSGLRLEDHSCHQGLGFHKMFDCFHYTPCEKGEIIAKCFVPGRVKESQSNGIRTELLGADRCAYFSMEELLVQRSPVFVAPEAGFRVGIVVEGEGEIRWRGGSETIIQGDTLFIPPHIAEMELVGKESDLRLVSCYPPI